MREIENILEKGISTNNYSESEIFAAINYFLKSKLGDHFEESCFDLNGLNKEEKSFMNFLLQNPKHELSTTEFYKHIGLSTRKGNIVKNDLMYKGMIKIDEIKYSKGWKKLIRLNNIQTTKQTALSEQPNIEITN